MNICKNGHDTDSVGFYTINRTNGSPYVRCKQCAKDAENRRKEASRSTTLDQKVAADKDSITHRILAKIRIESTLPVTQYRPLSTPCWTWTGAKQGPGYGQISIKSVNYSAHRAAYLALKGPIPNGKNIDHLCYNRACVNPEHLDIVTHQENKSREREMNLVRKTHCTNGHEFTLTNTRIDKSGTRVCRECNRTRVREHLRRKRANKG